MTAANLCGCFDWEHGGGGSVGGFLRKLLGDGCDEACALDESRRFLLLRWCTGRSTLPIHGDLEPKVKVVLDDVGTGPVDQRLPVAHTCSHEIDLPPYSSVAVLSQQLNRALDAFDADPSFYEE